MTTQAAHGVVYVTVDAVAAYFVSANLPLAIAAGVGLVALGLAALDWLLHIDGFAIAEAVSSHARRRTIRWLESFDPQ